MCAPFSVRRAQRVVDAANPATLKKAFNALRRDGFEMVNGDTFKASDERCALCYCTLSPDPLAPSGVSVEVLLRYPLGA